MLEKIREVPDGVVALRAVGKLTRQDYEQTVEPLLDEARRQGRRLRLLLQFGAEYEGFTADAVWGKTETWRHYPSLLRMIDGYATVSDIRWIREWVHLVGFLVSFPVRVFGNDQRDEALAWLRSLPEGPGVSHRLLPEAGVVVVEVTEPLRAQDFDALAATADAWLETHDALPGVVLHAPAFPGWENIGSLLRHVRFVRDHHRAVRRVALAVDSRLTDLAPRIAEHFVRAELRHFGYDELEDAVAWAAGADGRGPTAPAVDARPGSP
jgi:SpoIIAA-like